MAAATRALAASSTSSTDSNAQATQTASATIIATAGVAFAKCSSARITAANAIARHTPGILSTASAISSEDHAA